jgi:hypothetical protein
MPALEILSMHEPFTPKAIPHLPQVPDFAGWEAQLRSLPCETAAYIPTPASHVPPLEVELAALADAAIGDTGRASAELQKLTYTCDCSGLKIGDAVSVVRLDGTLTEKWAGEVARVEDASLWVETSTGSSFQFAKANGQALTGVSDYQVMFLLPAAQTPL